jgi:hypothetical protein
MTNTILTRRESAGPAKVKLTAVSLLGGKHAYRLEIVVSYGLDSRPERDCISQLHPADVMLGLFKLY